MDNTTNEPEDGEERNRHMHTELGKETEYKHAKTSETLLRGPASSHSFTVAEKYCAHCRQWTSTKAFGLLGFLVRPCCDKEW